MNDIEIEIFKKGDYGAKGSYSEEDLEQIARDYNPSVHEAPVTIDHAQSGPALGWVASLRHSGGRLYARLKNLNEKLLALIKSGALKKRSAELYKSIRETNRPYLRALSFLGAMIPEVKSLDDPIFSGEKDSYIPLLFESDEDNDMSGAQACESEKSEISQNSASKKTNPETEQDECRVVDIYPDRANLMQKLRQKEIEAFCEGAKRAGKLLPAWEEAGIVEFLMRLDDSNSVLFAEGRQTTLLEWFKNMIESMPPLVFFSEASSPLTPPSCPMPHLPGRTKPERINPASVDLYYRARMYMEMNPEITYSDALKRVF